MKGRFEITDFRVFERAKTTEAELTSTSAGEHMGPLGTATRTELVSTSPNTVGTLTVDAYDGGALFTGTVRIENGLAHWSLPPTRLASEAAVVAFDLPGFRRGLTGTQKDDWWCVPRFPMAPGEVPPRTQFLLWQEADASYGCFLPVSGGDAASLLAGAGGKLEVRLDANQDGRTRVEAPSFVVAFGKDPYALVERAFAAALGWLGHLARARDEKSFPEALEWLGWCTWDAFYTSVSAAKVIEQLERFQTLGLPVRFALVDDGWMQSRRRRIASVDPDPQKFPGGFGPFTRELKTRFGLRAVGLWHALFGYWDGVDPDSALAAELGEVRGLSLPGIDGQGLGFWQRFHGRLAAEGIDFIKVDGQGFTAIHTRGVLPLPEAARRVQSALQSSAALHFRGQLLNCMSMSHDQMWCWSASNVTRSSEDFYPKQGLNASYHARSNGYNSLWLSQLCWCDWDMWWTRHPQASYHQALRAISGGPLYVSDETGHTDPALLWPLILKTGRVLRCDSVGVPTLDCLFSDPEQSPQALKLMNRAGSAGMLCVLHATETDADVTTLVRPSDVHGLVGTKFCVLRQRTGERRVLERDQAWELTLPRWGSELFVVQPLARGLAVLGLREKLVMPKTLAAVEVGPDRVRVRLHEGGTLVAYSETPVRRALTDDGRELTVRQEGAWLEVDVPGDGPVAVWIER